MKIFSAMLFLFSFQAFSSNVDSYEKGFLDGYYLYNKFDIKVNPCEKMKMKECSQNCNYKDCLYENLSSKTRCDIIFTSKALNHLTDEKMRKK